MILLITVVYFPGYLYDAIFGNWLFLIGKFISDKFGVLKKVQILRKVRKLMEPKKNYLRYETPLCTYCFSYMTLIVIAKALEKMQIGYGLIIAFIIYPFVYFLGMHRRYRAREDFENALENNFEFLKLSFVPLAFLITIVGFLFTVTGFKI